MRVWPRLATSKSVIASKIPENQCIWTSLHFKTRSSCNDRVVPFDVYFFSGLGYNCLFFECWRWYCVRWTNFRSVHNHVQRVAGGRCYQNCNRRAWCNVCFPLVYFFSRVFTVHATTFREFVINVVLEKYTIRDAKFVDNVFLLFNWDLLYTRRHFLQNKLETSLLWQKLSPCTSVSRRFKNLGEY